MAASIPATITNRRLFLHPKNESACRTLTTLFLTAKNEEFTHLSSWIVSPASVSRIFARSCKGTVSSRDRCTNNVTAYGSAGSWTVGGITDIVSPPNASSRIAAQSIVPFSDALTLRIQASAWRQSRSIRQVRSAHHELTWLPHVRQLRGWQFRASTRTRNSPLSFVVQNAGIGINFSSSQDGFSRFFADWSQARYDQNIVSCVSTTPAPIGWMRAKRTR